MANRNLKTLSDAGVTIAMGTDTGTNLGQWQGYFEQVEIEMMVKAGLTPMQAIVASTGGAAKVMKLDQQLGTIRRRQAGRPPRAERESADGHPQHAADSLGLDRRPAADEHAAAEHRAAVGHANRES